MRTIIYTLKRFLIFKNKKRDWETSLNKLEFPQHWFTSEILVFIQMLCSVKSVFYLK